MPGFLVVDHHFYRLVSILLFDKVAPQELLEMYQYQICVLFIHAIGLPPIILMFIFPSSKALWRLQIPHLVMISTASFSKK